MGKKPMGGIMLLAVLGVFFVLNAILVLVVLFLNGAFNKQ